MVRTIGSEILIQPVFEHLMGLFRLDPRLLGTNDGTQPKFCIHVFMYRCKATVITLLFQVGRHTAVAIYTVVAVINILNFRLDFRFFGIVICLSMFLVIIVSIRAYSQTFQQPTNAEYLTILLDKSVSLYPISFAKNAAAFFRKRFSFCVSSSSFLSRRFSFINSISFGVSGLLWAFIWHSLLKSLHHFDILAFDTPYSAVMLC